MDGKKSVDRLFDPKIFYEHGDPTIDTPRFDSPHRAIGFALLLFGECVFASDTCSRCTNKNHRGPVDECLVHKDPYGKGACINCYIYGEARNCSIRSAQEKQEQSKSAKREARHFRMWTMEEVKAASHEERQRNLEILYAERARRREEERALEERRRKRARLR
ncbi:hypothetical protein VTJ04DRAFT_4095 [Mycothermus thermophilus]|uniref:uncharacterized protein n=1 Tax=Humicola insolens TaxID=85995 RepID=UPI003743DA38